MAITDDIGFYRLNQLLQIVPVSASCWWNGVKEGKFPQPVRLKDIRATCWRKRDIHDLVNRLEEEGK